MKRISTAACALALGAFALVGCGGSDNESSGAGADTTQAGVSDTTSPSEGGGDGSLGTIGSVPGLSEECTDLYNQYIEALGSMGTGENADISGVFIALKDILPSELQDDADVVAGAWAKYQEVLAKYDGDVTKAMADEDALAAIQALSDEKVNEASNAIGDYFSDTCPTG